MLQDDIRKAVEKNLSSEVGKHITRLLEAGEFDAKRLVDAEKRLTKQKEEIAILTEKLVKHSDLDVRFNTVKTREELATKLELEYKIFKLETELTASQSVRVSIESFLGNLVNNTTYRKNIVDTFTDGQPVTDGQGFTQYPVTTTKAYSETRSED